MADTARPSRLLRSVLVLSLALNLIVVGLVVGASFSGRWDKGPRGFDFGAGPIAAALLPDQRDALRDEMRGSAGPTRLRRADIAADLRPVLDALKSDAFDDTTLEAFFAQMQDRGAALQSAAQEALITVIRDMDAAERAAFAGRLEEALKRPRPRP
ncbi:periplasmic heavy metal sensor [Yoonia sp. 208BN28-4]|uniref:periplasmic heavy metal sensor n=1 Tax=Yoonia sp. 208BN28-4 TaxID=3126505 RepID=UPI0030989366